MSTPEELVTRSKLDAVNWGEPVGVIKEDGVHWREDFIESVTSETNLYTSTIPEGWHKICADELQRTKLTSFPRKYEFAKKHGLAGLDEVHNWMMHVRKTFENMVIATMPKGEPNELHS